MVVGQCDSVTVHYDNIRCQNGNAKLVLSPHTQPQFGGKEIQTMSAKKARRILSYNSETKTVKVSNPTTGGVSMEPVTALPKVELIALAKFLGKQFVGINPMAMPLSVLLAGVQSDQPVITYNAPKEESPMPKTQPKVAVAVTPQPAVGSIDAVIRAIVDSALAELNIGEGQITDAVQRVVEPIMTGFRHEVTEIVAKVQPKVQHISLPDRPKVELKGVKHRMFSKVLGALSQGTNLWLVGSAGTGKSTIAEQCAEALGLPFYSENCTATMTAFELKGYKDANRIYDSTKFRQAFEFGGVFVLDEIDNANPNVLGTLNNALSNGVMGFPDGMVRKHQNFIAIATANTFGSGATTQYVGRNPIDAATVDRFVQLEIPIDEDVEQAMLDSIGLESKVATKWLIAVRTARNNVQTNGLKVIVSPRATMNGAKLLRSGEFTMSEAFTATVLRGAKDDQIAKIMSGVTL